jgi:hypothetical protein
MACLFLLSVAMISFFFALALMARHMCFYMKQPTLAFGRFRLLIRGSLLSGSGALLKTFG